MKTKPFFSLRLALAGALALLTHTTFAQTWQTVDDFQYLGRYTVAEAVTTDPSGNVYVAGGGGPNPAHAVIGKSSDGGITWQTVDAFASSGIYGAITTDTAGNLYAVANYRFVRRSQDAGTTWSTVADSTTITLGRSIATDSAGNVYLVGSDASSSWIVLKGTQAGTSWSTVDSFSLTAPNGARPNVAAVFCHPTFGIFTAGFAPVTVGKGKNASTTQQWHVRRSLDGGASWASVDSATINSLGSQASGIGADRVGNIYVVGGPNWTVRKSSNGGATWATVDTVNMTTTYVMAGFAADSNGNLFVVGTVRTNSTSADQWLVRENPGGTSTWRTVDLFQYGTSAHAWAVTADNFGHVYIAGHGVGIPPIAGGFSNLHWIVRKN